MAPSVDLNSLVTDFEGALSTDKTAADAEVNAQVKFDAATVALASAKTDHASADANVFATGQALVAGIQAIIAPFAPPPPAE